MQAPASPLAPRDLACSALPRTLSFPCQCLCRSPSVLCALVWCCSVLCRVRLRRPVLQSLVLCKATPKPGNPTTAAYGAGDWDNWKSSQGLPTAVPDFTGNSAISIAISLDGNSPGATMRFPSACSLTFGAAAGAAIIFHTDTYYALEVTDAQVEAKFLFLHIEDKSFVGGAPTSPTAPDAPRPPALSQPVNVHRSSLDGRITLSRFAPVP